MEPPKLFFNFSKSCEILVGSLKMKAEINYAIRQIARDKLVAPSKSGFLLFLLEQ